MKNDHNNFLELTQNTSINNNASNNLVYIL